MAAAAIVGNAPSATKAPAVFSAVRLDISSACFGIIVCRIIDPIRRLASGHDTLLFNFVTSAASGPGCFVASPTKLIF
jgi:hypothetical protein